MNNNYKRVAITTLGCKVNQYESSAIMERLKEEGYTEVGFDEIADVYIVNTCTVTHFGDKKSRQLLRRATKLNPNALIVAMGCYAQVSPEEIWNIAGVDLVVGTKDKHNLPLLIDKAQKGKRQKLVTPFLELKSFEEMPAVAYTNRTRAFLKIQEGCNNFCAYCVIPYARGPLRSRLPKSSLKEAMELVQKGFKEIVLTGIHTGAYGKDLKEDIDISYLLREMAKIKGLYRLRLSSMEPMDFNEKVIYEFSKGSPICRHIHIPLQSGDNEVLERMRRHYTRKDFLDLVQNIRQKIPSVAITTDIIVGFPGETKAQFLNTLALVEEIGFAGIHVFKYSPRKGTLASKFPDQIDPMEKERRSKKLISLGEKMAENFAKNFIGTEQEVLAEEYYDQEKGLYQGFTDNYLKVIFPGSDKNRGDLLKVRIEELKNGVLWEKSLNIF